MAVALPVIAHGAALAHGFGVGLRQQDRAFRPPGSGKQQLDAVDRLAHVAAAGAGDVFPHALLRPDGDALPLRQKRDGPVHSGQGLLRGHGLELEDRAPAQDRVENIKVWVFRRGGDQCDAAVLDKFQKALLLLFIKILYLVQVEQHAAGSQEGA